ncbi:MAG: ABC transporter permease [Acidobacteria bacterium]|nr:ABC transporter permease [Acidobacteriota bacterium]
MRGAWLVFKKEFLELSKDRKTLFFTFAMPLILFPLLFTMMSKLGRNDAAQRKNKPSRIFLVDQGRVLEPALRADPKSFQLVPRPETELNQAIRDQKLEMALEIEETAAAKLVRQETFTLTATYDRSDDSSKLALERLRDLIKKQDVAWVQARLQTLGAPPQLAVPSRLESRNASSMALFIAKIMGSFLPYILIIMMYAGSMQHGIYTTAGEKERGTLLSLLSTRMPRNQIIWGKLLYIFAIGLLATLMNLLSMAVSMAHLFSTEAASAGTKAAQAAMESGGIGNLSAVASPATLGLSFLLMIPLGLFFSNFILLGGIQAKNTVEAGTALTPGIFVVVVLGVFSMAPGLEKMTLLPYVPIVNVSLAIRKLFSQQASAVEYLIALGMTVGLAGAMTWLSTRILNRESAIFKV